MKPPTWSDALHAGLPPDGLLLVVDGASQTLSVHDGGRLRASYPLSTAAAGFGCEEGSFKTPLGWHEVADRIGNHAPLGQVFQNRAPTGQVLGAEDRSQEAAHDLILTRILRLRGLEPGRNSGPGIDSYHRFIYLHGTNQERRLGQPASRGCLRMGNADIVELFDIIGDRPAWCWIGSTEEGHVDTNLL